MDVFIYIFMPSFILSAFITCLYNEKPCPKIRFIIAEAIYFTRTYINMFIYIHTYIFICIHYIFTSAFHNITVYDE